MLIKYSDAFCGAGKSRWAIEHMNSKPGRYLFAVDKIELIAAHRAKLKNVEVVEIHSKAPETIHVSRSLRGAAYQYRDRAHVVVFCTHAALQQSDLAGYDGWTLIIDEVPNVWTHASWSAKASWRWLDENFVLEPFSEGGWSSVKQKSTAPRLADVRDDALVASAATLMKAASTSGVVANITSWEQARERKVSWMTVWHPENLEAFSQIILLGNAVKKSLLYELWTTLDPTISWEPIALPYRPYSIRPVTIQYFSRRQASASFFESAERPLEKIAAWIQANTNQEHFYLTNIGQTLDLPGRRIRPKAHGFNQLAGISSCSILYANKPSPDEAKALELLGLTSSQVVRAREYEDILQGVMRSSARDPDSTTPVTIRVFSLDHAEFLATMLGDVTLKFINVGINEAYAPKGRPRVNGEPMTSSERQRRFRERRCEKAMACA
jgi:hypothetical protein